MEPYQFVTIGRVVRTQGRKGELKVALETDFPQRFAALKEVYLWRPDAARSQFELRQAWPHQGHIVLELAGITTIAEAQAWVGSEVQALWRERWPAPEGHYYISDLVGCAIWDHGRPLGVVEEVQATNGPPLLHLRTEDSRVILVPFVRAWLEQMDLAGRVIRLRLPDGLLDI